MRRRQPRCTRTYTLFPYTTLFLSFYGWEPCIEFAEMLGLRRSAQGFIATDMQTAQTSCAGVYAIGEVAQRQHPCVVTALADGVRSEEHTSELQSLMRISYAVFCLKKKI